MMRCLGFIHIERALEKAIIFAAVEFVLTGVELKAMPHGQFPGKCVSLVFSNATYNYNRYLLDKNAC